MKLDLLERAREFRPLYELSRWGLELARRMIVRWYITLITVGVCLVGVVVYARHQSPVYITTMKIIPASAINGGGGDSGGASFLGISLGGAGGGKMGLYLALMQSPTVAQILIEKYHYDKVMFGSSVDPATGKWKPNFERDRIAFLDRLFGIQPPDRPSVNDLSGAIDSMITLSTDTDKATGQDTGAVLVSCRSNERVRCPYLLTILDREAQAVLNRMSLEQTQKISDYLTREMPNVSEVEARTAMASMLASTQREIALSSLNEHSIATVLEGPTAGALPTFPDPQTMLFMGFMLGLMLGGAITWLTWSLPYSAMGSWVGSQVRNGYPRAGT